jgi:hypothetical protein
LVKQLGAKMKIADAEPGLSIEVTRSTSSVRLPAAA